MTSMKVPEPVMSLAVSPKSPRRRPTSPRRPRFQREDPTFKVRLDEEKADDHLGMGESLGHLHQRMKREYKCEVDVGEPRQYECIPSAPPITSTRSNRRIRSALSWWAT